MGESLFRGERGAQEGDRGGHRDERGEHRGHGGADRDARERGSGGEWVRLGASGVVGVHANASRVDGAAARQIATLQDEIKALDTAVAEATEQRKVPRPRGGVPLASFSRRFVVWLVSLVCVPFVCSERARGLRDVPVAEQRRQPADREGAGALRGFLHRFGRLGVSSRFSFSRHATMGTSGGGGEEPHGQVLPPEPVRGGRGGQCSLKRGPGTVGWQCE